MPRVKIDYIVSFSNEDPEHPASTLLAWDVSKKKWLCRKGEPSCSVVLQLCKAAKISSVTIGAHQAALVELLVGRSETPNDPFQVLVPSSVFQSPSEARRGGAAEADRVRSFAGAALAEPARLQRWDRLRLVASQPYNKHCQFGLSFVHVFSEEGEAPPAPSPSPALPARLTLPPELPSSDEEEFRPGELFAQHRQRHNTDTGAQIRAASSQALRNLPDPSIRLSKAGLPRPRPGPARAADRRRESLLYAPEDDASSERMDAVLKHHHEQRDRRAQRTTDKDIKDESHAPAPPHHKHKDTPAPRKGDTRPTTAADKSSGRTERDKDEPATGARDTHGSEERAPDTHRKRAHAADDECAAGPVGAEPHTVLAGVCFVLSGYENPRRAHLRNTALALGAACQRDWGPACTHLLCAFPNTPKLRAVRAGAGGARAHVVTGEWVEACARAARRLPERWFATEPARRQPPPPGWERALHEPTADGHESEDTDDEIERVRRAGKQPRRASPPRSPAPPAAAAGDVSAGSHVVFVADERIQGGVLELDSDSGGSTEEDEPAPAPVRGGAGELPPLLAGRTFAVRAAPAHAQRLRRYLAAYGGLVLDDEESEAEYVVCGSGAGAGEGAGAGGVRVRAAWLWRCHDRRRLVSPTPYILP